MLHLLKDEFFLQSSIDLYDSECVLLLLLTEVDFSEAFFSKGGFYRGGEFLARRILARRILAWRFLPRRWILAGRRILPRQAKRIKISYLIF